MGAAKPRVTSLQVAVEDGAQLHEGSREKGIKGGRERGKGGKRKGTATGEASRVSIRARGLPRLDVLFGRRPSAALHW